MKKCSVKDQMFETLTHDDSVLIYFFSKYGTNLSLLFLLHYKALTHCILNRLSHTIYWKSPISILGTCMSGHEIYIYLEKSGSALFAKYPFTCLPTTMG